MDAKNLSYTTLLSATSRILQVVIKLGALLLLGNVLAPQYLGAFTLLTTISFTITLFFFSGINQTASIFLINGYDFRNVVTSILIVFIPLIALILAIFYFSFSTILYDFLNIEEGLIKVHDVLVLTTSYAINNLFYKIFEGLGQIRSYSKLSAVFLNFPWILIFAGYLLTPLSYSSIVVLFVTGNIATSLFQVLYGFFMLYRKAHNYSSKKTTTIRDFMLKSIALYSSNMGFWIYTKSDIFVIQYFLGTSATGIYSLLFKVAESIQLIGTSIGSVYAPKIATNLLDARGVNTIFYAVNRFIGLVYLPIIFILVFASDFFVLLFFNPAYLQAAFLLKFYSIFIFFRGYSGTYSLLLDYLGFEKYRSSRLLFFAVANLILNIFVVQKYGLTGICLTTVFTYVPLVTIYMKKVFSTVNYSFLELFSGTKNYLYAYILFSLVIVVLRMIFGNSDYDIYLVLIGSTAIFLLGTRKFLLT